MSTNAHERGVLRYFKFAEVILLVQVIVAVLGLWLAWRAQARDPRLGSSANTFSARRLQTTITPAYPATSALCTALFVVDALDAQDETSAAQATYASTSVNSVINTRGYASEEDELRFLVATLQQYYLYAYNLYWSGTVSPSNPFSNNQCLSLLQNQNDQTQYEKLSADIEAYAAMSVKAQKPIDVIYALTLTYFITRVRIVQVQNATLDLSAAVVYSPSTNVIVFSAPFAAILSPQLGPQTKALVMIGSCTPAQLASTMLMPGEHNATFTSLSTGLKPYTFTCGSAS